MTGLVGWWPFHENSGSKAYDLSGNDNHGSLNGGITQGVAGKGGLTAYSFDGSNRVDGTGSQSDSLPLTISFWYRPEKDSNRHTLVSEGNSWWFNDDRRSEDRRSLNIKDSNGNSNNLFVSGKYEPNNWVHIVGVITKNRLELFNDGQSVGETTISISSLDNSGDYDTQISGLKGTGDEVNGEICDVRIYNRVLSPEEIQKLYDWGNGDYARPPESSGSGVSRWALDGDVTDSWSSNDGTTSGGLNFTNNAIRGQAANFDGVDDYIQTPLTSLPSKVSFSFWMKHGESTSGSKVISGVFDGNVSYQLQFNDGNYSWASYDGSSFHGLRNGPKVNLGEWIHVCAVYDGSDYIIYENGIEIDRTTDSFYGDNVSGVNIPVGAQSDSGNIKEYFDGLIDDVRIYDKVLSPEEIFELYRWGTRGRDMRKFTVNSRGL